MVTAGQIDRDVQVVFLVHGITAVQVREVGAEKLGPIGTHHQDRTVGNGVEVHHQAGVVGKPGAELEGGLEVGVRGAMDKGIERGRGVGDRHRAGDRQTARSQDTPSAVEGKLDIEGLSAGQGRANGNR